MDKKIQNFICSSFVSNKVRVHFITKRFVDRIIKKIYAALRSWDNFC